MSEISFVSGSITIGAQTTAQGNVDYVSGSVRSYRGWLAPLATAALSISLALPLGDHPHVHQDPTNFHLDLTPKTAVQASGAIFSGVIP
jgi:hypothetical protein